MDLSKLSTEELLAMKGQAASADRPLREMSDLDMEEMARVLGLDAPPENPFKGMSVDDAVRQTAKGVPFVGQYLDEANAATNAALHPVFGTGSPGDTFSDRYNANAEAERARDRQIEEQNPMGSTALQVGGGLASGGALLRAAPGVANVALGNASGGLLTRAGAGAAAGGAQGAIAGYGRGEGDSRLPEAIEGGVTGAAVGAAIPPLVSGVRSGINATRNYLATRGAASDLGVSPGAVSRVTRSLEADNLTPAAMQQRAAELGPEGMVMDMGRQLRGRAEAVAQLPGRGQNRVLDAVESRIQNSADRIGRDLDAELGRNPNIVQVSDRIEQVYNAQIRPAYEAVMQAHPQVWDDTLQNLTRRPSISRAIEDAVYLAREHGTDIVSPFTRTADGRLVLNSNATPSLAMWDWVKKSLDARIGAFARNPDLDSAGKTSLSALLETKRALVSHLDTLTGGEYARARGIAADKFAVQEALETGLNLFQNKLLPEQFQETVAGMGRMERIAAAAGARRALERIREVAPANMSEGGRQVYRELLQGGPDGDTAQKLRMLIGDRATNSLLATARRETDFQGTYEAIAANSRTSPRIEAVKDMAERGVPNMTLTGALNRAPALPVEAGLRSVLNRGTQRTREGVADLLTAAGPQRDRVLATLTDLANRRASSGGVGARDTLAALLMSTAPEQAAQRKRSLLQLGK